MAPYRRGTNLFESFRDEMGDLFDRFTAGGADSGQAVTAWAPRVDVEETEREVVVKADLPGVDPKDVDVRVVDNVLTVRGERKEQKDEKRTSYHQIERPAGAFYRVVPLPAGADTEKVTATGSNGTVTITIPKKPEAQPKRIAVQPNS